MGFEVVVRPAVLPNIRPPLAQVLPAEDNPDQGMCVIKGSPTTVGASRSWSVSLSRDKPHQESKRQFDKERVHQVDPNGKINKKNYVDVERLKKVRLEKEDGPYKMLFADPPKPDNVETIEFDVTRPLKIDPTMYPQPKADKG